MKQNQKFGMFMTIIISMIMAWLPSCSKDDAPKQWDVSVTDTEGECIMYIHYDKVIKKGNVINKEYDDHVVTLNIDSNMEWVIEQCHDVTVFPQSGKAGKNQLQVYMESNKSTQVVRKSFLLHNIPYDNGFYIVIEQKGIPYIGVSKKELVFWGEGDTETCTVTSNISNIGNLEIECPLWITASWASMPYPGFNEQDKKRDLSIRCERNNSQNDREGNVIVKSQDSSVYATIHIKQYGGW